MLDELNKCLCFSICIKLMLSIQLQFDFIKTWCFFSMLIILKFLCWILLQYIIFERT